MSSPGNPSGRTTSRNTNDQQIIGCVVSHCTNHQDGTAMLNPNSPGAFACVNSSFSHCSTETTSEEAPTDQAFTQSDRIENPNTFPIVFTRCTFSHMNSTSNGAAICIWNYKSLFSINDCHFYRCISTAKWGGGAVRHFADTDWISDFIMTESSFLECNASCGADAAGGSLSVSMNHWCIITSSIFRSSHATGRGGGCFFNRCGVNITNCVFERCVTSQNGGAIRMNRLWSLCCKNTAFRGCWYTGSFPGSKDVAIDVWTNQKIGKANFPGCDSTSGSPNVFSDWYYQTLSGWIPQIYKTTRVTRVEFEPQVVDDAECMGLTIDTAHALQCVMFVHLLHPDGSRLVRVPFGDNGTPSTRGSLVFPTRLPTIANNETFQLYSVSMLGWKCPTNIVHATTTLVAEDKVEVTLFGHDLNFNTFLVVIKDSNNTKTKHTVKSTVGTNLKFTESISFDNSSVFRFGETYTLVSIEVGTYFFPNENAVSFRVESPAVLSTVSQMNQTDSIVLRFGGKGFIYESYTLTIHTTDSLEPYHETTITLAPKSHMELEDWTVTLYPLSGADLLYGRTYEVLEGTANNDRQTVNVDWGSFVTPPEPTRIEECLEQDFHKDQMILTLDLKGRELMSYSGRLSLSDGLKEWKSMRSIEAINSTHCSVSFAVAEKETPTHVGLGRTYTLNSTEGEQQEMHVHEGIWIAMPARPKPVLSSVSQNSQTDSIVLRFGGKGFVYESYTLTIRTSDSIYPSHERTVTLAPKSNLELEDWTATLYPLSGADLLYGRTYEVLDAAPTNNETTANSDFVSFVTPPEPTRIEECLKLELNKDQTVLTLQLTGRELQTSSGKVCLSDGQQDWKSIGSFEAINSTRCSVSFAVAEKETPTHVGLGRTYTLKATEDDQHAIVVNDGILIEVPTKTAPLPRAVLSSISTDDSNGSLRVQLFGKNLVCPKYSITFSTLKTKARRTEGRSHSLLSPRPHSKVGLFRSVKRGPILSFLVDDTLCPLQSRWVRINRSMFRSLLSGHLSPRLLPVIRRL
ncbi:hypothetical protein BLNAU_17477 [Blattamonas nauphoetae]|uniref:Uncharacterized protein n=1 Tax=Blattamonas nauphoetae TaxID=2049346 RepID=A0ABQ9X779_9EUKA|nr:hypothetical protein BLNAU_17477 [Blattamonas nauphoetae]